MSTTVTKTVNGDNKPRRDNNKNKDNKDKPQGERKVGEKRDFNKRSENGNGKEGEKKGPRVYQNDKVGEAIQQSIENAIKTVQTMRQNKVALLEKMNQNKERRAEIKKSNEPLSAEFKTSSQNESKARKLALDAERDLLKRMVDEQKYRRDTVRSTTRDLPIKLKKDAPITDAFLQIERNIAEIEVRIENEKVIQTQRALIAEIAELQASKRRIQEHIDLTQSLDKYEEAITVQKQKIAKLVEERNKIMEANASKKKSEEPVRAEFEKLIKESNETHEQMNELAEQIKIKSAFIDSEIKRKEAHNEQMRIKQNEEYKKRKEERAARDKEFADRKRAEELASIPYEDELHVCEGLIGYLNTIKPRTVVEQQPSAAAIAAADDAAAKRAADLEGFQVVPKKEIAKRNTGKNNNTNNSNNNSNKKPVSDTIRHPMNIFVSFDKISLTPPEKYTQVEDMITQVNLKKEHFSNLSKQTMELRALKLKEQDEAAAAASTSTTTTTDATPTVAAEEKSTTQVEVEAL